MNKFAKRLKEERLLSKLSQVQLASKIGVTHTAIGLWEQGKRCPNLEDAAKLAVFFGVSLDYLSGIID